MSLTGSLLERTHSAIVFAFGREDLKRILPACLGVNFDTLVADKAFGDQVTELLLKVDSSGQAADLLVCLCAERQANTTLAALCTEVQERQAQAGAGKPIFAVARRPDRPVPLQKPLRTQHFIGRDSELARLLTDLQPGKVLTVCGPAGMGKTALAAEAVWRLAPGDDPPDRFPDGILFHTFYNQKEASLALEDIARAYGVDLRSSAQDAARLALANRKALLILDDAEAADDLPAVLAVAGTCGVLVASQRRSDAPADLLDIGPLPDSESLALLRAWAVKCADDDAAAAELVCLLGGLPFALVLVGSYLSRCGQQAAEFAALLEEEGIDALQFAERPDRSVPLLLRRSIEQVSSKARTAFGILGSLALAPFAVEPIAAALEMSPAAVHRALSELVDYGLLLRLDDRYRVTHALAHRYARTEAAPAAEAIGRLAQYYAALAETESKRGLPGYATLDRERAHIVSVQAAAFNSEQWDMVQEVAYSTYEYFDLGVHWNDGITVMQAGLDAARAAGSRYDEGSFLTRLAIIYRNLGKTPPAIKLYEQALAIWRDLGVRGAEGWVLSSMGTAYLNTGDVSHASALYKQALAPIRESGNRPLEGGALLNLGAATYALGDIGRAGKLFEQARKIAHETGDRRVEGNALGSLGSAYADQGKTRRAIELYEEALVIVREIGDRRGEATASWNLGLAYEKKGDLPRAIANMQVYVDYLQEIGHPDTAAAAQYVADLRARAGLSAQG